MKRVRGKHRSCGPFVVALMLGVTTDRAARLIGQKRANHRDSKVHSIRLEWAISVFTDRGIRQTEHGWYRDGQEASLHRWLLTEGRRRAVRNRFVLVKTDNHVLMVRNRRLIDNGQRRWLSHPAFAATRFGNRLDRKVLEWWVVKTDRLPVRRRAVVRS